MDKKVQTTLVISVLTIAALLAACSSPTSTPTPTPTPIPVVINMPQATVTATPTSLDPCQLIDSQEASALAGASFGAGEESTTSGGGRICTYGAQTANVFLVEVGQAPDVATAKAYKANFLADLQANLQQLTSGGLTPTELPNYADGAVTAQVSLNAGGETINGSAFGFLKGTVFFGFSDLVLGGAAPSSASMQSEADTVLGRLP
ncbi:MAG: hypothetical protein ABSA51_08855 [Anaerolineaceae bacterium]|jgi:hypothetical protein